jgi:hypothetical protein
VRTWATGSPKRGCGDARAHRGSPAIVGEGEEVTVVSFVSLPSLDQWRGNDLMKAELGGGRSIKSRALDLEREREREREVRAVAVWCELGWWGHFYSGWEGAARCHVLCQGPQ